MEPTKHYIACTVIKKDESGRIRFLMDKQNGKYSFPVTLVKSKNTALASVIDHLKSGVDVNVDKLELAELTNAVVREERIPLYVFTHEDSDEEYEPAVIKEPEIFEWVYYKELASTFEEWQIDGVPLLF